MVLEPFTRVIPVILQGLHWGGEAGVGSGLGHCQEGCGLLIVRLNAHLCTSHCSSSWHYLMRCKLTRFLFCMKKTKAECGQAFIYCYPTAGGRAKVQTQCLGAEWMFLVTKLYLCSVSTGRHIRKQPQTLSKEIKPREHKSDKA